VRRTADAAADAGSDENGRAEADPALSAPQSRKALPARRGGRIYLAGTLMGQACALLRYTVLARLLGPEQLGLVATLILVSNFFEMVSDTGSDRFLVQDREGDEPQTQKLVQLVFLGRGVLMALGLALAAWPVAQFYHAPPLVAGLVIMGLSPLLRGLMHLDTRRFQRSNDFRAEGFGLLVSEVVSLLATLVAAFLTRDYTAILYGLVIRSLLVTIISHMTAERPYRLGYTRSIAARLAAFSGPLILNGALLFVASQSDRLMISKFVGLTALGHYSAVLLLVLYPMAALSRYATGIHLPHVAHAGGANDSGSAADRLAGDVVLLSLGIGAGFALVGPLAVKILYGQKFVLPLLAVALIGALQAARFLRTWPTTLALGLGHSRIVLANNLGRLVGIPAAIGGYAWIGGVSGIVSGFMVGEFAAMATALLMLNRSRNLPWTADFDRVLGLAVGLGLVLGLVAAAQYRWMPGLALIPAAVVFGVWVARRELGSLAAGLKIAKRLMKVVA
jgi:O-antigen/teichoic acid export membrane protein